MRYLVFLSLFALALYAATAEDIYKIFDEFDEIPISLNLIKGKDENYLLELFKINSGKKLVDVLEAIQMITVMGLLTTGGLSIVSNGAPKHIRPLLDCAVLAMAMQCGFSSAIVNPCDKRLRETIVACDIIKNNILYADSVLEF